MFAFHLEAVKLIHAFSTRTEAHCSQCEAVVCVNGRVFLASHRPNGLFWKELIFLTTILSPPK